MKLAVNLIKLYLLRIYHGWHQQDLSGLEPRIPTDIVVDLAVSDLIGRVENVIRDWNEDQIGRQREDSWPSVCSVY